MFDKILIANRGEIACRVMETARAMGIQTVAIYTLVDKSARHVDLADEAHLIDEETGYLAIDAIIALATKTGAQAVHPGYGFLSENADFAKRCADAGIVFIGPKPASIEAMALKHRAKQLMIEAGVPVIPGFDEDAQDEETLTKAANAIGYPLLIKASAGGGGKGMRVVEKADDFSHALASAKREAQKAFADDHMILEKYLVNPRHVEVQVFRDSFGHGVHLFERDCSAQRRNQKVIEEAPAPGLSDETRQSLFDAALRAADAVDYVGAGTIEFMVANNKDVYFLEMNTRLQVEHPVTEMITGVDCVAWQLHIAMGEKIPLTQDAINCHGHAMEARWYAEDPSRDFLPQAGTLSLLRFPHADEHVRIDTGVREGDVVSMHYDPMLAKIITHGETRDDARHHLINALRDMAALGVKHNQAFMLELLQQENFARGDVHTGLIARDFELKGMHPDALVIAQALLIEAMPTFEPWRMNLPMAQQFIWQLPSVTTHVLVENGKLVVELDDKKHIVSTNATGRDSYRVTLNDEQLTVTARMTATDVQFVLSGYNYHFILADPLQQYMSEEQHAGQLTAPMPGTVVAILREQGSEVVAGDRLLVMEAMKMEHTLCAPHAGMIQAIHCREGEQVSEGVELIEIEAR